MGGVDVATRLPPFLLRDESAPATNTPAWSKAERDDAMSSLSKSGCVLLRGALTHEDVDSLRSAFGLGEGAAARRAGEVGQVLQSYDSNLAMGRYTFGRLHCLL